jgi:aspartyl-tRNA(Asn)/glutamyl-tRNA(Gln) amidotransferase subunit A
VAQVMELASLTATELLRGYADRTLSPVQVTEAVVARVEAREPELCATYAFDPERALAAARAAEERWQRGEPAGRLDGVPVMLKENIATAGTPMPLGTAAIDPAPAPANAPVADRLATSGAVLLGKTTMPDLGMLTSGLSSFHPLTRNPWDLRRNPGGSSAGAAAGVAAGYGPLHAGTDIGGSIRLPAAWCGIVGFKASFGRVPVDPPYLGRHVGPMTRSVADVALMSEVLAGPDPRDHMSLPPQPIAWPDLDRPLSGLRVGLHLDAGVGLAVEPEIAGAVRAAAGLFEQAGAHVEPMGPFLTRENLDGLDQFWRVRAWSDLLAKPQAARERALPYILRWAAAGAGVSGVDTYRGFAQIDAMSAAAVRACEPYDVVLSPVCPVGPPQAEWASPLNDPERPFEHIVFTLPYNMSGQPAISVNCGYGSDGMPIGLQIVGRRFADLDVLRAAAAFETMRGPQRSVA